MISRNIWVGLLILLWGCAGRVSPPPAPPTAPPSAPKPYKALGQWYQPLPDAKGFREEGIASWYGDDFHGKKTSSGEFYDMYGISAAHKTLPLGTYVRVKNLANNRQIDLRINDRGPFVRGRIIDLSYGAAREMGIVDIGTAPVEVTALGVPEGLGPGISYVPIDFFSGNFTIQVGAFRERRNAEELRKKLDVRHRNAHITTFDTGSGTLYRVRVGKSTRLEEAVQYEKIMTDNGFPDAFVVAE